MRISRLTSASCMLLMFSLTVSSEVVAEVFTASGNEPGWGVELTDEKLVFRTIDGELSLSPVPEPLKKEGSRTYKFPNEGKPFSLAIIDAFCTDTMSGMQHPKTVRISHGDNQLSGCGGDPAALLVGEWQVTMIDGEQVSAETQPVLEIDAEGNVSGNGSCNRIFGSYKLTGESFGFESFGSTQMFCKPPAMDQERLLLEALEQVDRFEAGTEQTLTFLSGDQQRIVAERK